MQKNIHFNATTSLYPHTKLEVQVKKTVCFKWR